MELDATPSQSSQSVRTQARAQLAQLRAERLERARARRRADTSELSKVQHAIQSDVQEDALDGFDTCDAAQAELDHAPPTCDGQEAEDSTLLHSFDSDAVENSGTSVCIDDVQEEVAQEQADLADVADQTGAPPASPRETAPFDATLSENSDLHGLPGAGPGLIWMLETCGIRSLADLAAADVTQLTADMGLVARILDLNYWIAFARGEQS